MERELEGAEPSTAPSLPAHCALVDALGSAGQWQRAEEAFAAIERGGLAPSAAAYAALVRALGQGATPTLTLALRPRCDSPSNPSPKAKVRLPP
jgi:pentatricopeptide repeat protein